MHRVADRHFPYGRLVIVLLVVVAGIVGLRSARAQSEAIQGVLQDSPPGMPDNLAAGASSGVAAQAARAAIQPRVQALADDWSRAADAQRASEGPATIPRAVVEPQQPPRMDSGDPNPDGVVTY